MKVATQIFDCFYTLIKHCLTLTTTQIVETLQPKIFCIIKYKQTIVSVQNPFKSLTHKQIVFVIGMDINCSVFLE
jgi:hypothetical protein